MFLMLLALPLVAQHGIDTVASYVYPVKEPVSGMEHYGLAVCYYNGKKVFNLQNQLLCKSAGSVGSLRISPDKRSFAVIGRKPNKVQVELYDLWNKKKIHHFKIRKNPTAIAYSPDGKTLLVASDSIVFAYGLHDDFPLLSEWKVGLSASLMLMSPDSRFLILADGHHVEAWDWENRRLQVAFSYEGRINDMVFSDDGSMLAVVTSDGVMTAYRLPDFSLMQVFRDLGEARSCAFHPMGKYVAVVSGNTRVVVQNLFDNLDRHYMDDEEGRIVDICFVTDLQDSLSYAETFGKGNYYLVYNTAESIKYWKVESLLPYYSRLVAEELGVRMDEWMQQMPGESIEDYQLRISEENKRKQMRLFEQEIATRMADDLGMMPEIALGNYNPESGLLKLDLEQMPTIFLEVPKEELPDFADMDDIELRNTRYGITEDDRLELVYADVYNKKSGKTYVFDNQERKPLGFLDSDDGYIPLEVALQSGMEELKLEEIKSDIVNAVKNRNVISDHTDIAVSSKVLARTDSMGNKTMDYSVDFSYSVEENYSVQEDFGPGQYKAEQSGAATVMLSIIEEAFKGEFASYVKLGKKLQVNITGMADALPIRGRIAYDGCYGDFDGQTVYQGGKPAVLTVTVSGGITDNNQLAFLRAYGFKDYITQRIQAFSVMDTDYRYHIEISEGQGGAYRRVKIQFLFVDAFQEQPDGKR